MNDDHPQQSGPPLSRRGLFRLASAVGLGLASPLGGAVLPRVAGRQQPALEAPTVNDPAPTSFRMAHAPSAEPDRPQPFRLTADSQLSQDFYRTADVLLDATDEVIAFSRPDGSTAALVLQRSGIALAVPDPKAPGGFSLTPFIVPVPRLNDDTGSFITALPPTGAAVGTHLDGKVYLLIAVPTNVAGVLPPAYTGVSFLYGVLDESNLGAPTMTVIYEQWRSPTYSNFDAGSVPQVSPKTTYDTNGALSLYAFLPDNYFALFTPGQIQPRLTQVAGSPGHIEDGALLRWQDNDYLVVFDDTTDTLMLSVGSSYASLDSYAQVRILRIDTIDGQNQFGQPATVPALLYWAKQASGSGIFLINLADLIKPNGNGGWFGTPPTMVQEFEEFNDATTVNAGGLWRLATTSHTDVNHANADVLSMIVQLTPLTDYSSTFTSPIPFQQDVDRVWAVTTPTSNQVTTLFIRNSIEQALQVITKIGAGGAWSRTPVTLSGGAVTQDVTHWRSQLTLRDANGAPVPNYPLQVTADERVAAWQDTANTLLSPTAPATFITDRTGRIVFSTPAYALHAAELTVTGSALPAVKIQPAKNIHAFLSQDGPLPVQYGAAAAGTLSSQHLINAAVPAIGGGTVPLATIFAGQSDDDNTKTADAVVSAVKAAARAGNATAPAAGQPTKFTFRMVNGKPIYSDDTQPGYEHGAQIAGVGKLSLGNVFDDIGDAFEDAWHAVENAVESVTQAAFEYVAAAGQWVGSIAVKFANGVEATFDYVIRDLKSAYAAVAGLLKTIGADLVKVIAWIRALLDGLIKDAVELAKTLNAALTTLPGTVDTIVTPLRSDINHLFTELKQLIDPRLTALLQAVGAQPHNTVGSASTIAFGATNALQSAVSVVEKFTDDVQANWFFNKLAGLIGLPSVSPAPQLTKAADKFVAQFTQDALTDLIQTSTEAVHALLQSLTGDAANVATLALGDLLQLLKKIFDQGVDLMDDSLQLIIDLGLAGLHGAADYLNASIDSGLLGVVNDVLDLLGINFDLTLGSAACLAIALPAVVFKDIISTLQPAATGSTLAARRSDQVGDFDDLGLSVYVVAVALQLPITIVQDYATATESDQSGPDRVDQILDIVSFVCSTIQAVLDYPSNTSFQLSSAPTPYQSGALHADLPSNTWLYSWLIELIPLSLEAVFYLPDFLDLPDDALDSETFVTTFLGVAIAIQEGLLAVDQLPNGNTAAGGTSIALAIVGWLSTALTVLAEPSINDTEAGLPVIVKSIVDVVSAIGLDALLIVNAEES